MIHVVDIGSWPEGIPPYKPLLDRNLGRLTEFDPQIGTEFAIGDGAPATLHVCTYPGWTSLLRPNTSIVTHFPYGDGPKIIREIPIETRRLDDLDIEPIDYMKIDAQGSELAILENGRDKLRDCAVIQLEVPFVPLYENQPHYWQLDRELRSQGFILFTFVGVKSHRGQLVEADALYVRDYLTSEPPGRKFTTILQHCYPTVDRTARAA